MKRILLILFLFLSSIKIVYSQSGWSQQNSGTSFNLRGVCMVDAYTGFISGDSGTILKTTNGGTNWIIQNSGTFNPLFGIDFINGNVGIAVGGNTSTLEPTILRTTNGGQIWSSQTVGQVIVLQAVCFLNSNTGYVVGVTKILRTTDGGYNWTSQYNAGTTLFQSISFADVYTGYVVGSGINGGVLKTTNGGDNWNQILSINNIGLRGVSFVNANTGTIVGDFHYIVRTNTGGSPWIGQNGGGNSYTSVIFLDENTGTVVGLGGYAARTTNGGTNWTSQSTGTLGNLLAVSFSDTLNGTAVGANGTIIHTTNGGNPIGIKPISESIPNSFSLSQNYPNPFNPTTKIKFSIPSIQSPLYERGFVTLKIYDLLGREVATLVNEKLQPGIYEVEWNGSNNASGVYFYSLKTDNFSQTKKLVLLK